MTSIIQWYKRAEVTVSIATEQPSDAVIGTIRQNLWRLIEARNPTTLRRTEGGNLYFEHASSMLAIRSPLNGISSAEISFESLGEGVELHAILKLSGLLKVYVGVLAAGLTLIGAVVATSPEAIGAVDIVEMSAFFMAWSIMPNLMVRWRYISSMKSLLRRASSG